ncbi:MAG: ABC transporter permease [Verrucomicrobia bacterium]|nr:ABC transporter permease [Verrucomicrobiota bacterium]MBV8486097.1 ABC transporter permease [Verrucomicrobiota bacterium]
MASAITSAHDPARRRVTRWILRNSLLAGFVLVFAALGVAAPGFLTWNNLVSVILNEFTLAAIISLGMTLVISAGGIDLSVGSAADIASLAFIGLVSVHQPFRLAVIAGLSGALSVGAVNASLIAGIRISPLLATLSTLFISTSVQQLASNGGQPIYLISGTLPEAFYFLGRGQLFGVPMQIYIVTVLAIIFSIILHKSNFGRYVFALGAQPGVAWYSGIRVSSTSALVYILSALVCGVAGILLSVTVKAYVPQSGNAYLLWTIGAVFIGTTLHSEGRPSVAGTLLGVLLLSIVRNGLLLIGWNFYWQQVATGLLIFAILAFSGSRSREAS